MTTPEQQLESMIANFPDKTGKPLEHWLKLVAASRLEKHGQIVKMLKSEHQMGHGYANLVAQRSLQGAGSSDGDLIEAQYAGAKAHLRPIHDAVAGFVTKLGSDVTVAPKKGSVSFRRSKQFALTQPSTRTRLDLGINLKGEEPNDRLQPWNAMISHRVPLLAIGDFDDQVKAWLQDAYQRA